MNRRGAPRPGDFRLDALFAALDEARRARGLAWVQVAREIHRASERSGARPLAAATLTGLRETSAAEADGVLQMLRWLERSPESFVPRHPLAEGPATRLPDLPPDRILRFDTRRLHADLDAARRARGLSWVALASELESGAGSLTRLARGGRTSFPLLTRITTWLGRAAAEWTHPAER